MCVGREVADERLDPGRSLGAAPDPASRRAQPPVENEPTSPTISAPDGVP